MSGGDGRKGSEAGRGLALLVAGAFFMENLDGTIISTAAPDMAASFGVRPADIGVAMTAYFVALAVFIPVSGWAADRYGARRVFVWAIAVFTLASALCAAAGGLPELVVMRVAQGIGGAMMVPVGRLAVLRSTRKSGSAAGDRLADLARAAGPGPRTGAGRPVHDVRLLALDLPGERAARRAGAAVRPAARPRSAANRSGPVSTGWASGLGGAGLAAVVLGLERFGDAPAAWGAGASWFAAGVALCLVTVRHFRRRREARCSTSAP